MRLSDQWRHRAVPGGCLRVRRAVRSRSSCGPSPTGACAGCRLDRDGEARVRVADGRIALSLYPIAAR